MKTFLKFLQSLELDSDQLDELQAQLSKLVAGV